MRIIAISDTHNKHYNLDIPPCDILIHSGDATGRGREHEIRDFAKWFNVQPATYKIFVPGNHEKEFEQNLPLSKTWFNEECPSATILINESIIIPGGPIIYGSPVTPWFHNWAWNASITELKAAWEAIPTGIDILVTHGPPATILDTVRLRPTHLGCYILKDHVLGRVKPKIHIFGHIHGGYGSIKIDNTNFYNVAICDEDYYTTNPITEILYE